MNHSIKYTDAQTPIAPLLRCQFVVSIFAETFNLRTFPCRMKDLKKASEQLE